METSSSTRKREDKQGKRGRGRGNKDAKRIKKGKKKEKRGIDQELFKSVGEKE